MSLIGRNPGDLDGLIRHFPDNATVVELGSFAGESASQFLSSPKVARLFCVDQWLAGYDDADACSSMDMESVEKQFDQILIDPRVIKLKKSTLDAAGCFWPASLDVVYIDACHQYEAVKADIEAYLPRLKPGAILSGHDFGPSHPGVMRAVRETVGEPDLTFTDSSWLKWTPTNF